MSYYTDYAIKRHEDNAKFFLARSQCLLAEANELDALGRDGDAMLMRENAYWLAQEATESFLQARKVVELMA
jgi:hypothetical protein